MAEAVSWQAREGHLLCLRTRSRSWLDGVAPGLSSLQTSRFLRAGPALWMRLGPDEWWCWTSAGAACAARVRQSAGAQFHALLDISDAQQAFEIQGAVRDVLSQGCELDFERLPPDFAGRSRCAAFTVVICPQLGGTYLWVEASLARSLTQWLDQARRLRG